MIKNNDKLEQDIVNNINYIVNIKKIYSKVKNINQKIKFLQYLASFMSKNVTTSFTDNFLETELNAISENLHFNLETNFLKGSVLHIMTQAYSTGGHTKLLEQIIENTSNYFIKQSILISNYKSEIPEHLFKLANTYGDFILLEDINFIQKAKELACIASKYEYIILHIHQDDILCNLAFGNSYFKRPIIFMNHSDHMFWVGASISDMILDLSEEGSKFSYYNRGVNLSKVVNIPIQLKNSVISKIEARKYLDLDSHKKYVLSIASEYKYGTNPDDISLFTNMALYIVNKVPNCEFLVIGPSNKNYSWAKAEQISNGRIKPLGIKERYLLEYYIISADLYIESFPFSSYTAFLETALYPINMLSLKTPIFTLDVVKENLLQMDNINSLQNRAVEILHKNTIEINQIDLSLHLEEEWTKNFISLVETYFPKQHQIYSRITHEPDFTYVNYLNKVIGRNLILNKTFSKLPFMLKLKLSILMYRYNLIFSRKEILKLIRKIFSF